MLEKIFDTSGSGPARVRSIYNGLHGAVLDRFSGELLHSHYANITARRHLRSAEHFGDWASHQHIAVAEWNESLLDRFSRHLRLRRCSYGHATPRNQLTGAALFMKHLRTLGIIDTPPIDRTDRPALLVAFRRWMRDQRGTQDMTLDNYDIPIQTLLRRLADPPEPLSARSLRQCFLKYSDGKSYSVIKHCATALRWFVRFQIAEGRCPIGLDAAIPLVPHWRLSSLPRYLQPEDVARILASCDPTTAVGKRDRAILLLLARLGLRAGDVVKLRVADVDWKNAWLRVSGKSRRETRLPLTQEVGDALVVYLQAGRPQTDTDRIFVCCCHLPAYRSHWIFGI